MARTFKLCVENNEAGCTTLSKDQFLIVNKPLEQGATMYQVIAFEQIVPSILFSPLR